MTDNSMFENVKRLVKKINYVLAMIGGGVVFLTIFSTTVDVAGRFLGRPLSFATEASQFALAALVFLGWAYTQEHKAHISIDLVYNWLPKRARRVLDMINPIFGIGLIALMTYQGFVFALQSKNSHEVAESMNIPVWPLKLMICIGAFMLCFQLILDMIDAWVADERDR